MTISTVTNEQLRERLEIFAREQAEGETPEKREIAGIYASAFAELLAVREALSVLVTDEMALAFHHALNDGGIGEADLEEIKIGLRGALCSFTAPPAPAVPDMVGLSVSVDVSTSDDNAGYRYFGRITEVQQSLNPRDKGGVVLLVQDDVEANFNEVIVPEGFKLVPVEPTPEMCNVQHVGVDVYTGIADDGGDYSIGGADAAKVYRAMLAAAPTPTK